MAVIPIHKRITEAVLQEHGLYPGTIDIAARANIAGETKSFKLRVPPQVLVDAEDDSRRFVADIKRTAGASWVVFVQQAPRDAPAVGGALTEKPRLLSLPESIGPPTLLWHLRQRPVVPPRLSNEFLSGRGVKGSTFSHRSVMASAPLLPLDALTAPLPQGDPGPPSLFRDLRGEFERLIREKDLNSPRDGDPPKKADWQGVVDLAQRTLTEGSKDLRVAAWLTVGLTHVARFAGLRDGLRLLTLLVTDCWDRLNPPVDGDPRVRGKVVAAVLSAEDELVYFPRRVRLLPLLRGEQAEYGSYHLRHGPGGNGSLDREDLDRAKAQLPLEESQQLAVAVAGALQELDLLKAALASRMPSEPQTFSELQAALQDCQAVVDELRRGALSRQPGSSTTNEPPDPAAAAALGDVVAARKRVYEQLTEAAAKLEQLEGPSSPIPDVLRKVARWGQMPYRDLLRADVLKVLSQLVTHADVPPGR